MHSHTSVHSGMSAIWKTKSTALSLRVYFLLKTTSQRFMELETTFIFSLSQSTSYTPFHLLSLSLSLFLFLSLSLSLSPSLGPLTLRAHAAGGGQGGWSSYEI